MPADLRLVDWRRPPDDLHASHEEVHLWRASLRVGDALHERLWAALAPAERDRAERFRIASARGRFVAARGFLRVLLGRYLREEPEEVLLGQEPLGKPIVLGPHAQALRFNLSHSADLAVYAVALGREVGVDVEEVRPDLDVDPLLRWLSDEEQRALRTLSPDRRVEVFFATWTRKEAVVKALGQGLRLPFRGFSVGVSSDEPAEVSGLPPSSNDRPAWSLRTLVPAPSAVASLAVEGRDWRLCCYEVAHLLDE